MRRLEGAFVPDTTAFGRRSAGRHDRQKFRLLERLQGRRESRMSVVVVMTVPVSANDYRRAFPDWEVSRILERADGYYRLVSSECTKEQKFVLTQLADDGVLNPMNDRAIRQLVRRGLITSDPQFRVVNESFRRFVRFAPVPDLKVEWLRESRRSGWARRIPDLDDAARPVPPDDAKCPLAVGRSVRHDRARSVGHNGEAL